MKIDPEPLHTKVAHAWDPGKCIPQAPITPRYVIRSYSMGDHTQYMKYHVLIGNFLGLWPSERDLARWIKSWWNPKGHFDLYLDSKGFFTTILHNLC
jgi:hypothetical protein